MERQESDFKRTLPQFQTSFWEWKSCCTQIPVQGCYKSQNKYPGFSNFLLLYVIRKCLNRNAVPIKGLQGHFQFRKGVIKSTYITHGSLYKVSLTTSPKITNTYVLFLQTKKNHSESSWRPKGGTHWTSYKLIKYWTGCMRRFAQFDNICII